ncbi:glycosyltransferase family 4 protein [Pelovirga terrestris]|uniref:Glycosyltransferase family 4 protein n=1 Tax=Pelovirga terrestris TaxID=2771352 RepID=A0A8J6QTJ2_9BACT|nr:glycosyltransferase family 4 protein [Pelovirga terrestris]MBD1399350.1 glycosyltransferase family 4 protein [Pelovirga terrestris]
MKPKVFISIATAEIGGPGKGLLQFFKCGGMEKCTPLITGFGRYDQQPGVFEATVKNYNFPFVRLIQSITYDPRLVFQSLRIIKDFKPDILQSHSYKSHVICFCLKIITGTPWIAFFHGWCTGGFKIKLYKYLDKFLFGFADRVVVVSNGMASGLNKRWIGKNKIYTIYNAVDPNEYALTDSTSNIREQYGICSSAPLIGVVGRFSHEKGHCYFVEALPQIIKKIPGLKVLFIGDGPLQEEIQQQVDQSGLKSHVIFTGYQSNVQNFYREIDLLVLPSLSEGMPNVALEAMLFGKPVVATRVGGVPEVVVDGETGILVDSQNAEQLSAAVIRLFKHPEMLRDFGVSGRERVLSEFNPEERVKKIAALYEEVLATKMKFQQEKSYTKGESSE